MSKVSGLVDVPPGDSEPEVILPSEERQVFDEVVAKGLAQAKAGEAFAGEAVFKWLASWGKDDELPPPLPGHGA